MKARKIKLKVMKRICSKLNLKSRLSGIDMRFKKIEGTAMSIRYRS